MRHERVLTLGMAMIDRRKRREMGADVWRGLLPVRTLRGSGSLPRVLTAGLVLTGLIALHPQVIGMAAIW